MLSAPDPVRWPGIAPMDEYVREKLLPVLRKGWPGLERSEIRGVSREVLGKIEAEKAFIGVDVIVEEKMDWAWNATVRD